ncbi:MAG: hypothetical protein IH987_02710 [Planctomycetes bacterium]|nr:hypothetical protein [Planctomycetota bacterium]
MSESSVVASNDPAGDEILAVNGLNRHRMYSVVKAIRAETEETIHVRNQKNGA